MGAQYDWTSVCLLRSLSQLMDGGLNITMGPNASEIVWMEPSN
jgi:hypothetical protein